MSMYRGCAQRVLSEDMTYLTQDLNGILWIDIEEDNPSWRVLVCEREMHIIILRL